MSVPLNVNELSPAGFESVKSVETTVPTGSTSVAVTCAGRLSEYVTSVVSLTPSPFGVIVVGLAATFASVSVTAWPLPICPWAGRTVGPAAIVQT